MFKLGQIDITKLLLIFVKAFEKKLLRYIETYAFLLIMLDWVYSQYFLHVHKHNSEGRNENNK